MTKSSSIGITAADAIRARLFGPLLSAKLSQLTLKDHQTIFHNFFNDTFGSSSARSTNNSAKSLKLNSVLFPKIHPLAYC